MAQIMRAGERSKFRRALPSLQSGGPLNVLLVLLSHGIESGRIHAVRVGNYSVPFKLTHYLAAQPAEHFHRILNRRFGFIHRAQFVGQPFDALFHPGSRSQGTRGGG